MKKYYVAAALLSLSIVVGFAFSEQNRVDPPSSEKTAASAPESKKMTIYRDPNCGCCDAYADYLDENGYQVTRVDDRNFGNRSISAGVPEQGLGCHLAEIDGYIVSGLVPVEIIERLMNERPQITGITLPGMPDNAPGMSPEKTGTLKIYAFSEDGVSVYSNE